ncbi:alpha/beta hydrolase [Micromonospora sp. RP3T]|uniref:alpha/beta hydrolase n=1 Tax=Micromonospora sp. RP3T TaxID=2135446 RepID=UPI001304BEED|nr:alpha/beta hydrolase [Micromonospora sp. RP3T]
MTAPVEPPSTPPDPLHPDARRLMSALLAERAAPLRHTGVAAARARAATLGRVDDEVLAGTVQRQVSLSGGAPALLTGPAGRGGAGVLLHLHGGGWCLGSPGESAPLQRLLAHRSGLDVLAVAYPLAPEAPYPAAVRACDDLLDRVYAEVAGERPVLLSGDSAGGNLAIVTALRHARRGGPPLAGLALLYPVTDHDLDRPSYRRFGTDDYWVTTDDMRFFWEQYVPDEPRRADPDAAPLRAPDLALLPPTLLDLAGCDVLRDEGLLFADRLRAAGVPVTCRVHDGQVHGFATNVGVPSTDAVITRLAHDLRELVRAWRPTC